MHNHANKLIPKTIVKPNTDVSMYARHYCVPVSLVRAIIERESNWRACAVSAKGAKGLMQLMPATARRLGVRDSCNINQNISGGVRYLAWLMRLFHNDLRLVAAGYYAGEDIVARHDPTPSRGILSVDRPQYSRRPDQGSESKGAFGAGFDC